MKNNLDDFDQQLPIRPSFLTWLCILTFIGSGWSILNNIWAYSNAGKTFAVFTRKQLIVKSDSVRIDSTALGRESRNGFFRGKIRASIQKMLTKENIRRLAIGKIIASLFTLAGAILMWNLNRKGFYLYIVGVIITAVVPFYLFGNDLIAVGTSVFSAFFGLIFITLYALNLSAMKRNKPEIIND